jgi:hypothetical protein
MKEGDTINTAVVGEDTEGQEGQEKLEQSSSSYSSEALLSEVWELYF